jgi:hypothetical protein
VLFPAYAVSEYVLRRPVGALVVTAERDRWPAALVDFFTFNEEHTVGVVPTALFDFNFRPSVGLYGFWDDAFARNNALRFRAATGGTDWLALGIADRFPTGKTSTATVRADWTRRPDGLFAGIGPRSLEGNVGRFAYDRTEAAVDFASILGRQNSYRASAGFRRVAFHYGSCCDDPSIETEVAKGAYPAPPALAEGYELAFERVEVAFDSRSPRPAADSGVRLELAGTLSQRLDAAARGEWATYGAALGGLWDVTGHGRVLSLWLSARFLDAFGDRTQVPFTELVALGGAAPMRGFKEGRLLGDSAAVATLQHEWPIWVGVHGSAQIAFGNVFGDRLRDFELSLLRASAAIGLRTAGSEDHYLEILVGGGTETIQDGFRPASFRLLVGGNHGF